MMMMPCFSKFLNGSCSSLIEYLYKPNQARIVEHQHVLESQCFLLYSGYYISVAERGEKKEKKLDLNLTLVHSPLRSPDPITPPPHSQQGWSQTRACFLSLPSQLSWWQRVIQPKISRITTVCEILARLFHLCTSCLLACPFSSSLTTLTRAIGTV